MLTIYIFECNDKTEGECFEKSLFGTYKTWPLGHVRRGDVCFLFNYYGRKQLIYGVYMATCDARPNIVPGAWGGKYPNQVSIQQSSRECIAIPRAKIDRIVTDPATRHVHHHLYGPKAQDLLDYFSAGYAAGRRAGQEMDAFEKDFREKYEKVPLLRRQDGSIQRRVDDR